MEFAEKYKAFEEEIAADCGGFDRSFSSEYNSTVMKMVQLFFFDQFALIPGIFSTRRQIKYLNISACFFTGRYSDNWK